MAFVTIHIIKDRVIVEELPDAKSLDTHIAETIGRKNMTNKQSLPCCEIYNTEKSTLIVAPDNNITRAMTLFPGGQLDTTWTPRPYPGIDVEYIPDNNADDNTFLPRVLMEKPDDTQQLRALVWDGSQEDYNVEIKMG